MYKNLQLLPDITVYLLSLLVSFFGLDSPQLSCFDSQSQLSTPTLNLTQTGQNKQIVRRGGDRSAPFSNYGNRYFPQDLVETKNWTRRCEIEMNIGLTFTRWPEARLKKSCYCHSMSAGCVDKKLFANTFTITNINVVFNIKQTQVKAQAWIEKCAPNQKILHSLNSTFKLPVSRSKSNPCTVQ